MFRLLPCQLIPVSASDVAFSVHAVTLTAFTVVQALIYDVSIRVAFQYLAKPAIAQNTQNAYRVSSAAVALTVWCRLHHPCVILTMHFKRVKLRMCLHAVAFSGRMCV